MAIYYVSGIAQITVRARSAEQAVAKAQQIAARRETKACYIDLDNIANEHRAAVPLEDAASLDGTPESAVEGV